MENVAIPLFCNSRYRGEVIACDADGFTFRYENSLYSMKLFNVVLNEEGRKKVCSFLEGNVVEVEIDELASIYGIVEAYVFVEDDLLQTRLIESGLGRMYIKNPEYKYINEMILNNTQEVGVEIEVDEMSRGFDRTRANQFMTINLVLILVLTSILWGIKKVKKTIK